MVEKCIKLNRSSVVFHSPIFIFKRLVMVKRKPYICDHHTYTKNLNAVKAGAKARKKNHYMQLKSHPL